MAFFDDFKEKAADLAQVGMAKSKQLAEIARLNLVNAGEEDTIRKAYQELGRIYYAERGNAPEPAYSALCEKITAARITIEENKERIAQLRAEGTTEGAGQEETAAPSQADGVDPEVPPEDETF
ncbi:serine proteinase [Pseudoflavonifractor phocaeensis]|uniref:serine proteinase n=1 Tax=Pseudoflavonifractor phocaeensis TaxID=1870988 RepID=UPI00195C13B4|nr:serine proteinase [Pseudoflavonifractor phocaeensis]MBM6869064.1 serine proteinase [Pseudoflavonifractor phocaeensis]MBM6937291.1 serine proteinase [Pseudoflavonifractor phocaeensis]